MSADNMQEDRAASVERSESNLSTDRQCTQCVFELVSALHICETDRLKSGQTDTDTKKLRRLKKMEKVNKLNYSSTICMSFALCKQQAYVSELSPKLSGCLNTPP